MTAPRKPTNSSNAARKAGSTVSKPATATAKASTTSAGVARKPVTSTRLPVNNRTGGKGKPQTLAERLGSLSSTTWTLIAGAAIVLVVVAIIVVASNQNKSTVAYSTCGVTTPVGQLTKSDNLAVGAKAPLTGSYKNPACQSYSLDQYIGNKVVLMELFAPWCPHCQAETTILNQIQNTMASKGVQVMAISASPYGHNYETAGDTSPINMGDVKWFDDGFNTVYPSLFDPALHVANTFGLNGGFPTYYIIDKTGTITYVKSGEVPYTDLQTALQQAMNNK